MRNTKKPEWDPMGKWVTLTRKLTSVDAKELRTTYSVTGSGPTGSIRGTRVVDGRAMTITDDLTAHALLCGTTSVKQLATKVGPSA